MKTSLISLFVCFFVSLSAFTAEPAPSVPTVWVEFRGGKVEIPATSQATYIAAGAKLTSPPLDEKERQKLIAEMPKYEIKTDMHGNKTIVSSPRSIGGNLPAHLRPPATPAPTLNSGGLSAGGLNAPKKKK